MEMRSRRVSKETAKIIRHMEAYFKHGAPRAPRTPRGTPHKIVLYRGVTTFPEQLHEGLTVESNGGCYTAMTYNRYVADDYGGDTPDSKLFHLSLENIARGTPWAWFGHDAEWNGRRGGLKLPTYMPMDEGEVLLPPGYFKVLKISGKDVDVAYVPEPRYLPHGVLPRVDGPAVKVDTPTARHSMQHPRLRAKVKERADRIARAKSTISANVRGNVLPKLFTFLTHRKSLAKSH